MPLAGKQMKRRDPQIVNALYMPAVLSICSDITVDRIELGTVTLQ